MTLRTVPFPEAGADAFLRLDFEGLEALGEAFGLSYISIVEAGLAGASPIIITRCLSVMLHGEDDDGLSDAPWDLSLEEIGGRLLDALYLCRFGKTVAEVRADEIALLLKQREILEEMGDEDPDKFMALASEHLDAIQNARRARIAKRLAQAAIRAEERLCQP